MKLIGIDIDEVLSDTVVGFLKFFNNKHGTKHTYDEITDYSFTKSLNISPDEEKANLMEFFASKYFVDIEPITGSVEAIQKLSRTNELFAISSRPPVLMSLTNFWLDKYFKGCFREVILTDSHFDSSITKSKVCIEKHLDYFVEDVMKYAEDCASVGVTVFLLDKPWNRIETGNNVIRVKDWLEILSKLDSTLET